MVLDTRTRLYFISFAVQTLLLGIFLSATSVSLYLTFYGPSHRAFRDKFVLAGISVVVVSAISVYLLVSSHACNSLDVRCQHWGISFAAMHTALFTQNAEDSDNLYSIDLHNPYLEAQMYLNDISLGVTDALFVSPFSCANVRDHSSFRSTDYTSFGRINLSLLPHRFFRSLEP